MYLSELFLQELDETYSLSSTVNALKMCDNELCLRSEKEVDGDHMSVWDKQGGIEQLTEFGYELMDFWDVYKEFDLLIEKGQKEVSKILDLVRSIRSNLMK